MSKQDRFSKNVTALVPMKKHSERVPGKNMKLFNGEPLLYWILHTISQVNAVSEILINTDSDEIASFAEKHFEVKIIKRPERLQGDSVSMNKIIAHDLEIASSEHLLQTHATNPLLKPETVRDAISTYGEVIRDGCDSLFSVTPLQTRLYNSDGTPLNHEPDALEPTQNLDPVYEENSNLYLFSKSSFRKRAHRIGDHPYLYTINKLEACDIDTQEDFKLAELLCKHGI